MMSEANMQAIVVHRYGGSEELQLERLPIPKPGEGEVLVRVHAAGVLPVDWKIRQGLLKFPTTFPYVPGSAMAGVVEEAGAGVSAFHQDQRVFGRSPKGSYAEYAIVPIDALCELPEATIFEEGAAIYGGATTAWQALVNEVEIQPGDRVLIHGAAGGVGLFATQFAKWKGAYVIATAGASNVDFVRSLGADEVIDYRSTAFEEVVSDIDVVFDTIGGQTLERSWPLVKRGGALITIVGMPSQEMAQNYGIKAIRPTKLATSEDLEQIARLLESGQARAFIAATFRLSEATLAHELSQTGHGRGRIVLKLVE
jgi:NADPH:quinone reductase-like Zn-dependent oxidoreductase